MEFGNLTGMKMVFIPLLTILILILGIRKREDILSKIGWKNDWAISITKIIFISLGVLLVFIAFLSPQKLKEEENIQVKGNDIYVLMDISRSMLAKDTYPNRLEVSKKELKNILKNLKGDRVGIIPFSDSAYVQMPLTDDYFMAFNYIDAIDSKLISGGGTRLMEALELANKSFEKSETKNKNVIIFSDGGEREEKVIDFVKQNNIHTYIFGVGTEEGSVISLESGFLKDKNGEVVISKLNDSFLKELAKVSKGGYYLLNNLNVNSYKNLLKDLDTISKTSQREERKKNYERYYQIPLSLGLIFILLGYFIRKREKRGGIDD